MPTSIKNRLQLTITKKASVASAVYKWAKIAFANAALSYQTVCCSVLPFYDPAIASYCFVCALLPKPYSLNSTCVLSSYCRCMHPKDFCLGALSLVAAVYLYRTLTSRKGRQTLHKYSNWRPLLVPGVVLGLLVILNLLSSIMVFVFGVVMPIGGNVSTDRSGWSSPKRKYTPLILVRDQC